MIWHAEGLGFTKTLALDGRRITVAYAGAPEGHRVGNEFSVDLRSAMTGHGFPARSADAAAGTATLTGTAGGSVTITPTTGCCLSPASLITDPAEAEKRGLSMDFLRLHRVLTDAVVIKSGTRGAFEYAIDVGS